MDTGIESANKLEKERDQRQRFISGPSEVGRACQYLGRVEFTM